MKLKPNVLNDLAKDHALVAPAMPAKYRADDNRISIEDESGRIVLTGAALEKEFWVTGRRERTRLTCRSRILMRTG